MTLVEFVTTAGSALTVGGALVIAFGKFWADRSLEGLKSKYVNELEALKNTFQHQLEHNRQVLSDSLARGQFVHKLQFETEFKTYPELWRLLLWAKAKAMALRPILETLTTEQQQNYEQVRQERFKEFAKAYSEFRDFYLLSKPFVAPVVYEATEKLANTIHGEGIAFRAQDPQRPDYWEVAMEHANAIVHHTDLVCDAIRIRIGVLASSSETDA